MIAELYGRVFTLEGNLSGLTPGRVPFAATARSLTDDADLAFATDTLIATKIIAPTSVVIGNRLNFGVSNQLYMGFDTDTRIFIDGAGTTAFGGVTMRKARGTQAARTNIVNLDTLGRIEFQGYSAGYFDGASLLARVDGTVVSGQAPPTSFVIATNDTNALPVNQVFISPKGYVGIHVDPPQIYLHVFGSNAGSNPANSGTAAVGVARFVDDVSVATDFGASPNSPFPAWIQVHDTGNQAVNYPLSLQPNGGGVGIGTLTPTATLHLAAGAAAAGKAPLKLTAGTLLTTPEIGAIEFTDDGTTAHCYVTVRVATVVTRVQIA